MSETPNPDPERNPERSPEEGSREDTDAPPSRAASAAETPSPAGDDEPSSPAHEAAPQSAETAVTDQEYPSGGGRRVTSRTVNRREVTEHTVETITEDIPLEAYQGPSSTHPAPVG